MASISLHVVHDKPLPVLGEFSKALPGSHSLNFARSGGKNCDPRCSHFRTDCYAERCEIRPDRAELAAKLARHESTDPAELARRARYEIGWELSRGIRAPWFRLFTNGSVPSRPSRRFALELRQLLAYLHTNRIPVHFPIETLEKARTYRRVVQGLCVVRESCHTEARWLNAAGPVSISGGSAEMNRIERVNESKRLCRARTMATGRKCIVCPAVASRYIHGVPNDKAKCGTGGCTACANPFIDVVYPKH